MSELKPCPKCKGKAALNEGYYDYDGGDRYYAFSAEVECLECGLLFKVHNDYPKKYVERDAMWDFAIEAWNTRHEETCEGCKYHRQPSDYWCEECSRYYCDFYTPKEDTDAD